VNGRIPDPLSAVLHLLHTAGDPEASAGIQGPEVAGAQPALGIDGLRGGLGIVIVAEHDAEAAREDLPDGAGRLQGVRLRIPNGHLRLGQWLADGFAIVGGGDAQDARTLGLAVNDVEGATELRRIRRTSSGGNASASGIAFAHARKTPPTVVSSTGWSF
jgi:hypothetical protein